MLGKWQGAGSLCRAAPLKRSGAALGGCGGQRRRRRCAIGKAPLSACSPGWTGPVGRREGSAIRTATSPRAGTSLRRPQREPGHGTRGERSRRRRSGESARPSGGTQPFCGNGAGPGHPFLGRPLPASPRRPARRPLPFPRRGRDARGGGARAARPHSPPGGSLRPPSSSGGSSGGNRCVPETEAREEVRSREEETVPFPGGGAGCGPGISPVPGRGFQCFVDLAVWRGRVAERGRHTGRVMWEGHGTSSPGAQRPLHSPWPPALSPEEWPSCFPRLQGRKMSQGATLHSKEPSRGQTHWAFCHCQFGPVSVPTDHFNIVKFGAQSQVSYYLNVTAVVPTTAPRLHIFQHRIGKKLWTWSPSTVLVVHHSSVLFVHYLANSSCVTLGITALYV